MRNSTDECCCHCINRDIVDPSQTGDADAFLRTKEVERKEMVLFDLANVASVFSAIRGFWG